MSSSYTLEEAITLGRGTERPFRCHEHEDNNASASVNVVKGVWYCYGCLASGTVDDTKAPGIGLLLTMTNPERAARHYPESYLDLFDADGYWATRFPAWLRWQERLGEDPFTGEATFPVRTPAGVLAGLGRRSNDPEARPRYKYPARWSASRSLGGLPSLKRQEIMVLVEGYADRVSLIEHGIAALCCYGAGLHAPQAEMLRRINPAMVLTGFDMDEAGERATDFTREMLADSSFPVGTIRWPEKDPADTPLEARLEAVIQAVRGHAYASDHVARWSQRRTEGITEYERTVLAA